MEDATFNKLRREEKMVIKRFEDVEGWKEARILAQMIYSLSRKGKFKSDFGLRDQMCRAVVSISSNIAEGFESASNAEFVRFLCYSRRSAAEVKSQLYVALDNGYITQDEFDRLYAKTTSVSKLITAFIKYLRSRGARTTHLPASRTENQKPTTDNRKLKTEN
jgi:four helix bundle protein